MARALFGRYMVVNEFVSRIDEHWVWDSFDDLDEALAEARELQDGTEGPDSPHYAISVRTKLHGQPRSDCKFAVVDRDTRRVRFP